MAKSEPRYLTIYKALKQEITSGTLQPDTKLPTELELAATYQVSRITSKRALTELENQGLIYRQQGSGSFVKSQTVNTVSNDRPILFVLPFPSDNSLGDYATGVSQAATKQHLRAVTMDIPGFSQLTITEIKANYTGIIYLAQNIYSEIDKLYTLTLSQIPVVLLDKLFPALPLPSVSSDNFAGGQLATEHLIELGHQHILFFATTQQQPLPTSVYERFFGYLNALHQHQLEPVAELTTPHDLTQLNDTQLAAFLTEHHVTGLVVENDLLAIQLMNRLRNLDEAWLNRLSIVGFDDIQAASLAYPTLTTVAQNFQQLGVQSLNLLLKTLKDPSTNTTLHLPVKLIKRASTHSLISK